MKRYAIAELRHRLARASGDVKQYANGLWADREAAMDAQARAWRSLYRLPPRLSIVARRPSGSNVVAIPVRGKAS